MLRTGIVGMAGAFLGMVGDEILLGRPVSGLEALALQCPRQHDLLKRAWRLPVGSLIGAMAIPVAIVGLWHIVYALRPAGNRAAWTPFLILAHMLIVGAAFHGGYMLVGPLLKMQHSMVQAGETGFPQLVQQISLYHDVLGVVSAVELVVGGIWFAVVVARKQTRYPRWMAITNPAICGGFPYLIGMLLPAPIGGFVAVTGFNFGALSFIALSTWALTRRRSEMG